MCLIDTEIKKLIETLNDYITTQTSQTMSTLLGEPIKHRLNLIHDGIGSIRKIPTPSDEFKMYSIRLNGKGDVHIELLFTIKRKHAIKITSKLMGKKINEIDEMGTSALQEVANILTGSFFNALSANTGFKIDLSIPSFKEGLLEALVLEPTQEIINPKDHAIITDCILWGTESNAKMHIFIIQHPAQAKRLISRNLNGEKKSEYADSATTCNIGSECSEINSLIMGMT